MLKDLTPPLPGACGVDTVCRLHMALSAAYSRPGFIEPRIRSRGRIDDSPTRLQRGNLQQLRVATCYKTSHRPSACPLTWLPCSKGQTLCCKGPTLCCKGPTLCQHTAQVQHTQQFEPLRFCNCREVNFKIANLPAQQSEPLWFARIFVFSQPCIPSALAAQRGRSAQHCPSALRQTLLRSAPQHAACTARAPRPS